MTLGKYKNRYLSELPLPNNDSGLWNMGVLKSSVFTRIDPTDWQVLPLN